MLCISLSTDQNFEVHMRSCSQHNSFTMVCGAMRDKAYEMNDPAHTCNKDRKPQIMKIKTNQTVNVIKKSQ